MFDEHEIEYPISDTSPYVISLAIADELRRVARLTETLDSLELARSLNEAILRPRLSLV